MAKSKPDDAEILTDFSTIFRYNADYSRTIRELTWYRNILFYLGEQWISWFVEQGGFGPSFINPAEFTPVANKIRDHVRSMKALILNKKYAARIWPNSETQKDKDAAKLGGMAMSSLDNDNCNEIEDIKEWAALWLILTGNAFIRTYANLDNGIYFTDADGKVQSKGEVTIENIIGFSIVVPSLGVLLKQKSYVGIRSLKDKEWVEDTYKVKLGTASVGGIDLEYEKRLMTLVANVSPWKTRSLEQGSFTEKDSKDLVYFQEVEYRPTKKYPKGRYVAVADGKVLENETKMPIKVNDEGEWFYTITDFKYNNTPGSFWATSSVDDLISPQKMINEIDKDFSSNRASLGRPYVLTPTDLVLKRQSEQGQTLLVLQYEATQAYGSKPEVVKGTPFPDQVLAERKLNIENIQDAGGDPKNILKGQSPTSGASGIMVDILREAAEMSHSPDVERFYRSWNRVKKKQLILAKELITETRLLKMTGEGNEILIKAFKGADLYDNTDVRMEKDSGVATTNAGQNQFIMKLIEQGFFGAIPENPRLQYEIMKRLGMSWLPVVNAVHEERAGRENSMASQATDKEIEVDADEGTGIEPVLEGLFFAKLNEETQEVEVLSNDPYYKYDNHQVHYDNHTKVILNPDFKDWPVANQKVLINHTDMHHYEIQAQEQAEMERAAQMAELKYGDKEKEAASTGTQSPGKENVAAVSAEA